MSCLLFRRCQKPDEVHHAWVACSDNTLRRCSPPNFHPGKKGSASTHRAALTRGRCAGGEREDEVELGRNKERRGEEIRKGLVARQLFFFKNGFDNGKEARHPRDVVVVREMHPVVL
jgi:hypothetical protein